MITARRRQMAAGSEFANAQSGRLPFPPFYWNAQMINAIISDANRIGLTLAKIAHDLAHVDLKSVESVADRALLLRLQRCAHDAAIAFQLALPR